MRIDHELQMRVLAELDADYGVDSSHIGVTVRDGIVTLSGHVGSSAEKRAAEIVAGRVAGVHAVIDDLLIELPGRIQTNDEQLAERCFRTLAEDPLIALDRFHLSVKDGIVTIHGDVDQPQHKTRIEEVVIGLDGVQSVVNDLAIKPPVKAEAVREKVRRALEPISAINADSIEVTTAGTHVILSGVVNSWHERGMAESAVWSVPGVTSIDDRLVVRN